MTTASGLSFAVVVGTSGRRRVRHVRHGGPPCRRPGIPLHSETYQFDGLVGSFDHVFASPAAFDRDTGADIWNINAFESVGREYSRFNNNVTDLYAPDPFRASDHDPEIVGFGTRAAD